MILIQQSNILIATLLVMFIEIQASAQSLMSQDSIPCIETISWLSTNCDTCRHDWNAGEEGTCIPQQFGRFGEVEKKSYFYGIYKTYFAYNDTSSDSLALLSFRIFEQFGDTNSVKPILSQVGADFVDRIEPPELILSSHGTFIHVFMSGGVGGFDFGVFFIRDQNKWYKLNIPEWPAVFQNQIPKGDFFCKGGFVDLNEMKVGFPVFKSDDSCCCPNGGWITARLTIKRHDLLMDNVQYWPGQNSDIAAA